MQASCASNTSSPFWAVRRPRRRGQHRRGEPDPQMRKRASHRHLRCSTGTAGRGSRTAAARAADPAPGRRSTRDEVDLHLHPAVQVPVDAEASARGRRCRESRRRAGWSTALARRRRCSNGEPLDARRHFDGAEAAAQERPLRSIEAGRFLLAGDGPGAAHIPAGGRAAATGRCPRRSARSRSSETRIHSDFTENGPGRHCASRPRRSRRPPTR